jgi:hypothetical protein
MAIMAPDLDPLLQAPMNKYERASAGTQVARRPSQGRARPPASADARIARKSAQDCAGPLDNAVSAPAADHQESASDLDLGRKSQFVQAPYQHRSKQKRGTKSGMRFNKDNPWHNCRIAPAEQLFTRE